MRSLPGVVLLLIAAGALGQQHSDAHPQGLIYGVAMGQDGRPARQVGLAAFREGLKPGDLLPQTGTNAAGEYCFRNLAFGKYIVYAYDNKVGYGELSTGKGGPETEVEITSEHPIVQLLMRLPPKGAFLYIDVTNRSGVAITNREIAVMSSDNPESPLFVMTNSSKCPVLIPSDKPLLVHVKSDGFLEWEQSVGSGKLIDLAPGSELTLHVQLDPEPVKEP
jgi:hypothetical protein